MIVAVVNTPGIGAKGFLILSDFRELSFFGGLCGRCLLIALSNYHEF